MFTAAALGADQFISPSPVERPQLGELRSRGPRCGQFVPTTRDADSGCSDLYFRERRA
jgi:hypothetical protein